MRQALHSEKIDDDLMDTLHTFGVNSIAISPCCQETINDLVRENPMMVCQKCRNLIKCFIDEKSFRNYIKFCQSRGRKLQAAKLGHYLIITFKNYNSF